MSDYLRYYIERYRETGLLLDTNLFLLLVVGIGDKKAISEWKRTKDYSQEDFDLLIEIIKHFKLITTPNILTEASNFADQAPSKYAKKIIEAFIATASIVIEKPVLPSTSVMGESFEKFGLADSVAHTLANEGFLFATDDFPLYHFLTSQGIDAINFTQIRLF